MALPENEQRTENESIEIANVRDLDRIAELNKQLNLNIPGFEEEGYDQKDWILEEIGRGNFFVFKSEGLISGAACIILNKRELHIETLAVDRFNHGKGVGKKLVEFATGLARDKKLKKVTLETYEKYGVKDFYLKCGFEPDKPPIETSQGQLYYRFVKKI